MPQEATGTARQHIRTGTASRPPTCSSSLWRLGTPKHASLARGHIRCGHHSTRSLDGCTYPCPSEGPACRLTTVTGQHCQARVITATHTQSTSGSTARSAPPGLVCYIAAANGPRWWCTGMGRLPISTTLCPRVHTMPPTSQSGDPRSIGFRMRAKYAAVVPVCAHRMCACLPDLLLIVYVMLHSTLHTFLRGMVEAGMHVDCACLQHGRRGATSPQCLTGACWLYYLLRVNSSIIPAPGTIIRQMCLYPRCGDRQQLCFQRCALPQPLALLYG